MAKKNHILNAITSIAAAQAELEKKVSNKTKIIDSQGFDIAELEKKVMELRNNAICAEVASGVPTKDVAKKYQVSAARVSQIAPRKSLN